MSYDPSPTSGDTQYSGGDDSDDDDDDGTSGTYDPGPTGGDTDYSGGSDDDPAPPEDDNDEPAGTYDPDPTGGDTDYSGGGDDDSGDDSTDDGSGSGDLDGTYDPEPTGGDTQYSGDDGTTDDDYGPEPLQDDEFNESGADWSDDPIGPEDDISENDLTDDPVPTQQDIEDMRFAQEEVTIGGETYQEGELLPPDERIARDIEREIIEDAADEGGPPVDPGDIAVGRTDEGFETAQTEAGAAEDYRRRQFRQRQAEQEVREQVASEVEGASPSDVVVEDTGQGANQGVRLTDAFRQEQLDQMEQELERGVARQRYGEIMVAGSILGAAVPGSAGRRIDRATDPETVAQNVDLQRGEDYTIEMGDETAQAQLTEQFRQQERARQREEAIGDLERQLEQQYGADLDREDYAIQETGRDQYGLSQLGDGQSSEETQLYATLTAEGEETVAVQNAPLRDAPVIGGLTTSGARARQRELQATDPFAEAFRETTPGQEDVGEFAVGAAPGGEQVAAFGSETEATVDEATRAPRQYTQSQLDELRSATLDATPGVAEDEGSGAGDAAAATAAVGVTGTAAGTATGTGTGIAAGLGSAAAGTGVGAGVLALGGIGAGYARGGVERRVRRETVTGVDTGPVSRQVGTGEIEVPEDDSLEQPEMDAPDDPEVIGGEMDVPEGEPVQTTRTDIPDDGVFTEELDETTDPTPTNELPTPGETPSGGEEAQRPGQDETTVPGDYPLPGRDMPADPSRDYVPGERGDATVGTSPVLSGGLLEEAEERTITEEDIDSGFGSEPARRGGLADERARGRDVGGSPTEGPTFRRRRQWQNPYVRWDETAVREFPTGEESVVGRGSTAEARDLIEEAQRQQVYQDTSVGTGTAQTPIVNVEPVASPQTDSRVRQDAMTDTLAEQESAAEQRQRLEEAQEQRQETQQETEQATETEPAQRYATPVEPGYGTPTATPTLNPPGFGTPTPPRRPYRPDGDGSEPDAADEAGDGGLSVSGGSGIGAGWYSEYLTATALGSGAARGSPSESALEDRPESEAYTSTLPTEAQVSGTEEEQEAIEEAYAALTFGAAGDGDDGRNEGNMFNLGF